VEDLLGASDAKGAELEAGWPLVERERMKTSEATEGKKRSQGRKGRRGSSEKRRHALYVFVSYILPSLFFYEL